MTGRGSRMDDIPAYPKKVHSNGIWYSDYKGYRILVINFKNGSGYHVHVYHKADLVLKELAPYHRRDLAFTAAVGAIDEMVDIKEIV
jgi:hypothetical protein